MLLKMKMLDAISLGKSRNGHESFYTQTHNYQFNWGSTQIEAKLRQASGHIWFTRFKNGNSSREPILKALKIQISNMRKPNELSFINATTSDEESRGRNLFLMHIMNMGFACMPVYYEVSRYVCILRYILFYDRENNVWIISLI